MAEEQKSPKQSSTNTDDNKQSAQSPPTESADSSSEKAAQSGAKAKTKKDKPPAPEEKPFRDFIQQDYLPQIEAALQKEGLNDLALEFEKHRLDVLKQQDASDYWQVVGRWEKGQRQFNVAFLHEDIKGPKIFSYADGGAQASTVEQFMGDERKITLDLMVLYLIQRLNAQKWLTRN
ncbi:MAG: DUF2996 domain-containing protein [Leptolyngbyaceae cyanobacterium SM1_1_3]|nr:DUF2996 domain-containing protein [Leptolyngbyaceae cyanobacterium SM1_1_3]NJN02912.1 DUF2996 domain-containing protein [Leptolyngbyaceae cyanobacterium RM1_1_2]NJO09438.1 DUF2996 domain-containing protein [Leptolyngbyaceae cyanobacterium SL_1_1]